MKIPSAENTLSARQLTYIKKLLEDQMITPQNNFSQHGLKNQDQKGAY